MHRSGSYSTSWKGCARRQWCNGGFRQSVPESLRNVFKKCIVLTAESYNSSTVQQTQDYFFLPAAAEVWKGHRTYGNGSSAGTGTAYSNIYEFNQLTRFEWYEIERNLYKAQGHGGTYVSTWSERSPWYNDIRYNCFVMGTEPGSSFGFADSVRGISPVGCL